MEAGTGRVIRLVIVGAGNVATHLAKAFEAAPGVQLAAVVSRSSAVQLVNQLEGNIFASNNFELIGEQHPDVVLISVADNAMAEVVSAIGQLPGSPLVLHTSGTLPKEMLEPISPHTGILYPLQTFSREATVDISSVPFFNEAASEDDLEIIDSLASSVSRSVHHADADHRKVLHIAGVFSSNFPNILFECTGEILSSAGYGLEVVEPLVRAMVDKAFAIGPHAAQTGPARRGDYEVIHRQQEALSPDLKEIYSVLTEKIIKSHNNE